MWGDGPPIWGQAAAGGGPEGGVVVLEMWGGAMGCGGGALERIKAYQNGSGLRWVDVGVGWMSPPSHQITLDHPGSSTGPQWITLEHMRWALGGIGSHQESVRSHQDSLRTIGAHQIPSEGLWAALGGRWGGLDESSIASDHVGPLRMSTGPQRIT